SQPSPFVRLPSSHSSPAARTPLPHVVHRLVRPSASFALPSSHSSPGPVTPLPQSTHAIEHGPLPFARPASHSSLPAAMPLPHDDGVQVASQPSPLVRFPSSQPSVSAST